MPVSLSIEIDPVQLAQLRESLSPQQFRQAYYQAIKRTLRTGVTRIKKAVRDRSNIAKKYIDRVIKDSGPSGDPPVGKITIKQKSIPAIGFPHTELKSGGVSIRYGGTRGTVRLKHAFIGTVRTKGDPLNEEQHDGHEGIFLREKGRDKGGKLTATGFARRLPIKQVMGGSVLGVVEIPEVFAEVQTGILAVLEKNVKSQMDRFLDGNRGDDSSGGD